MMNDRFRNLKEKGLESIDKVEEAEPSVEVKVVFTYKRVMWWNNKWNERGESCL